MPPRKKNDARLDRIQRGLTAIWGIYFGWYMMFVSANIAALVWLFNSPKKASIILGTSMLWIMCNVLGVGATVFMGIFTRRLTRGQRETEIGFPVGVAYFAVGANSLVMAAFAVNWIIILRQ